MGIGFILLTGLCSAIVGFIANGFLFIRLFPQSLWVVVPVFFLLNLLAGTLPVRTRSKRLRICHHGTLLLSAFCVSVTVSVLYHIFLAFRVIPGDYMTFIRSLILCIAVNAVIFWNGILCVYLTSTQLGIKTRLIGILCGMIPLANVVVLFFIIKTTARECAVEIDKERLNRQRRDQKICATQYPILLVHGVFFRDHKVFNYWGRIPQELEANGATLFYGNHPSAASIADSAAELKTRIEEIVAETGAEKVNIIAHSKGGLDCRYAISELGISDRVASLTTVNTPHRGCLFADYLLTKIPADIKNKVARTYNTALNKLGEPDADFLAAVNDLTDAHCRELNRQLTTPPGIFCQSIGSVMPKATGGTFPLNFSCHLVKFFSGENDGLVSEGSFEWGEKYTLLKPTQKRGISHADMIDLTRENVKGFDVREFYVRLVSDLKKRGL